MRISRLLIRNFRGIKEGKLLLRPKTVLVGDNNIGKSSVLEAIDLVLGPDRLSRPSVINEHDFYAGEYLDNESKLVEINIEVVVVDLTEEQQRHFRNHLEWWHNENQTILDGPPPESTDEEKVVPALRVSFTGRYDEDEDDFIGKTYFESPIKDDGSRDIFGTKDKRLCGFLLLRTLRTGSRALSLERGSLLDIIVRLKEINLPMWEEVLVKLRKITVADDPALGVTEILTSVQEGLRALVPSEWADKPHFRVSDLTRSSMRKALTVFMGTGAIRSDGEEYAAPFHYQGTGTINTLVLTLLSMIAELKHNVIFAMEEPEIAIPPHTQKRIIHSIIARSSQAIFTSHSPYVLEELDPSEILVITRQHGTLSGKPAQYPPSVKPKAYRDEFRRRFCEALLTRTVLITEGRTEYDSFPAAARRLQQLFPFKYRTLEELGIAIVNAEGESKVATLGAYFRSIGKTTLAVFDKQTDESKNLIDLAVDHPFEAQEKGFEDLIVNGSDIAALRRYARSVIEAGEWPTHLSKVTESSTDEELKKCLREFFKQSKAAGVTSDFINQCKETEMPSFITHTLQAIQAIIESRAGKSGDSEEDIDDLME